MFLVLKRAVSQLRAGSYRAWAGVILAELLIVVIGVYVAEGLSTLREQSLNRERLGVIAQALRNDIDPFIDQSADGIGQIRRRYDQWEAELDSGAMPLPMVIPATTRIARPHMNLWTAMLNAGGLDLIPLELLRDVADFYDRYERLVERYNEFNAFSKDHVMPYLDAGAAHFYTNERQLRPIYEIYRLELNGIIQYAEETVELGLAVQGQVRLENR